MTPIVQQSSGYERAGLTHQKLSTFQDIRQTFNVRLAMRSKLTTGFPEYFWGDAPVAGSGGAILLRPAGVVAGGNAAVLQVAILPLPRQHPWCPRSAA